MDRSRTPRSLYTPYASATVTPIEVTLLSEQRPACQVTPDPGSGLSDVLLVHSPCDCGFEECLGIVLPFIHRPGEIVNEDVSITVEDSLHGPVLVDAGEALATLLARESSASDGRPSEDARALMAALSSNPDVEAWNEAHPTEVEDEGLFI